MKKLLFKEIKELSIFIRDLLVVSGLFFWLLVILFKMQN